MNHGQLSIFCILQINKNRSGTYVSLVSTHSTLQEAEDAKPSDFREGKGKYWQDYHYYIVGDGEVEIDMY